MKSKLLESANAWSDEVRELDTLSEIDTKVHDLMYEIQNSYCGSYTGCYNAEDLAEYIMDIAYDMQELAREIKRLGDRAVEDEDADEEYDD